MASHKIDDQTQANRTVGFIKNSYPIIVLAAVGYVVISIINFFNVATGQSIASFRVEDFELDQISDKTIIATKDIAADDDFPFAITKGERVIRKGFPVTEDAYQKLRKISESPIYMDYRAFVNSQSYLLIVMLIWFLFFAVTPNKTLFKTGHHWSLQEYIFQVFCFIVTYTTICLCTKYQALQTQFIICAVMPCALFVLLESLLYGTLNAVFFSIMLSLGVFNATGYQIVPLLWTLSIGLFSSIIVKKIERRTDMVFVAIVLAAASSASIVILAIIFNEPFRNIGFVTALCSVNGFLSAILALGFVTPLELLLNTASIFRLMDLSDLNSPLMKKLLIMASGTYQHSLMVAQLSEAACRDIGCNALIARVGSYYHDIGKMDQSEYFVENQTDGVNKHNTIKPSLSATVIKSHVRKGVEMAQQLHLPSQIVDIIEEHHGNSLIAYFFNEAKKLDPNANPADYSYTGTLPSTKESGVVMIADTVEAACRTLKDPNEKNLDEFIQKLISAKISSGQLDNSTLTFRDIAKARAAFIKILVGYYHNRIKYPDQGGGNESDTPQNTTPSAAQKDDKGQNKPQKNNTTNQKVKDDE